MLSCRILSITDCVSALPCCPNEVRLQINVVYSHPLDCLDLSEPGFNWPRLSVSLSLSGISHWFLDQAALKEQQCEWV